MYGNVIQLSLLFFLITQSVPAGDEWPDWRGPYRDGTWNEKGIKKSFKHTQIPLKWTVPISSGFSGPSVAGGKVYITDRLTFPDQQERVHCFDAETGKTIWSYNYDCTYQGVGYQAGPRASVILDKSNAYSLGTMGHLFCFDASTGAVIWKRDLNEDFEIRMPTWGIAAAPLIYEDLIILQIGGEDNAGVIALNKEDGNEAWRNLKDDAGYSAPILIQQGEVPVVVIWTGNNVVGMNPDTGAVYWSFPFDQKMVINISTPVMYKEYLFLSCFFDGSMLLKLDVNGPNAEKVWQRAGKNERNTDALHCCISTPLIKDDHIYGVDSYGELRCLDLKTGDRIWEDLTAVNKARWANIHIVQNGDLSYLFNENGKLIIAELTPERYHEISRAALIAPTTEQLNRQGIGVTWAHPAFANKHVFIRNDKELVCADLSE